jgi:hypothetical protein
MKNRDANLRKWLKTPVKAGRTDALKEHDSVT